MADPFGYSQTYIPQTQTLGPYSYAPGSQQSMQPYMPPGQQQPSMPSPFGFGTPTQSGGGPAQTFFGGSQPAGGIGVSDSQIIGEQPYNPSQFNIAGLRLNQNPTKESISPGFLTTQNTAPGMTRGSVGIIGGNRDFFMPGQTIPSFNPASTPFSVAQKAFENYFNNLNAYKTTYLPEYQKYLGSLQLSPQNAADNYDPSRRLTPQEAPPPPGNYVNEKNAIDFWRNRLNSNFQSDYDSAMNRWAALRAQYGYGG